MVQVLAAPQRRSSFSSQLGLALGTGLGTGLQERMQREASSKQLVAEQQFKKDLIEREIEGKLGLEKYKQEGKESLLKKKQEVLNALFGGQSHDDQSAQMLQGIPPKQDMQPKFDPSSVPDSAIAQATAIDPALGRELRAAKDTALREKRAEREHQEKLKKESPEYQREIGLTKEQVKADQKYYQDLQSSFKQHKIKSQTLDRLSALNKKGVTGKPFEKLLEKFGLVNVTSEGRREFAAEVKNLITDIRSILGSQFSQFEFQTLLNAYPSADFSEEANNAIIKNLKDFQEIRDKEFEIANDLKKENKGRLPPDMQSEVNSRLGEFISSKIPEIKENINKIQSAEYGVRPGEVLMFDPNGEPLSVPKEAIEGALSRGAVLP